MSHSKIPRDITGQRFGTLTALRLSPERNKHGHRLWVCKCDCGTESTIIQGSLTTGNTQKCNDHPKNMFRIQGDTTWIDISTDTQPNATTQIDTEDAVRVLMFKSTKGRLRWMAHDTSGCGAAWGNYAIATDRKTRLHRLILNLGNPQLIVDHINGDTFDNRKSNLRIITRAENNKNVRKRIDNTSGKTGVSYISENNNYKASIQLNGVKIHLGTFNTIDEAAAAYFGAAKVLGFSERHGK